jgi:WD40 repeat protein
MKSCPNDISSVVVSLVYLNDNRRFLAGYVNGTIRLYDESKLDDCFTLRTFDVFNSHHELLLMCHSPIDRSVVTAGSIGQPLKLWDFDTGKCDLELEACDESETVVSLLMLEPYPLILTADSAGCIVLWGSRGCKWKGDKISSFMNINPLEAEMEPPSKGDHYNGIPPQRVFPTHHFSTDEPEESSLEQQSYLSSHHSSSLLYENNSNQHSIRGAIGDEEEVLSEFKSCERKWGKVSAATKVSWDSQNHVLYTGDELGHLRKWSVHHIIEELGGMSMMHGLKHVKTKITTRKNPKKGISGVMYTDTNATASLPLLLTKKTQIAFMGVEFCWALQGHNETIIECVATKHGVLTSSTDNLVKMWTTEGLFIGTLLHSIPVGIRSHSWDLPIDIQSIREQEEKDLDEMMVQLREMNRIMKENSQNLPSEGSHPTNTSTQAHHHSFSRQGTADYTRLGQSSLRKRIEMSGRLLGLDFSTDQESSREALPSSTRKKFHLAHHPEKRDEDLEAIPQRPHTSHSPSGSTSWRRLPHVGKDKPRSASNLSRSTVLLKGSGRGTTESSPETLRIEISPNARGGGGGAGVRQSFQNKIITQVEKKCSHLTSYEKLENSIKKSEYQAAAGGGGFLKPILQFGSPEEKERRRVQTILDIRKRFNLAAPVLASQNTSPYPHNHPPQSMKNSKFESDQHSSSAFSLSGATTPADTPIQTRRTVKQLSSAASIKE